jgi:hypothetical protein
MWSVRALHACADPGVFPSRSELQMHKTSTLVLAAALLMTAACSSKSTSPTGTTTNPTNTSGNQMSAKVDGVQWNAVTVVVNKGSGYLIVSGGSVGEAIAILFATTGTGTQNFTQVATSNGNILIGSNSWIAGGTIGSGSVTITTLTANRAVGTFSFTGQAITTTVSPQQRQVTNGAFDVTF